MAAVMACGEGAVLERARGRSPSLPPQGTRTGARGDSPYLPACQRCHDPPLAPSPGGDMATWRGIPTTTVPRTLVDLAASLPTDNLARACHEAGVRHRTTPRMVEAVLARHPSARARQSCARSCAERFASHSAASNPGFWPGYATLGWCFRRPTARRRTAGGLPLARAAGDGRARQLPIPPVSPRLGAGPAPRARGPCQR